MLFTKIGFECGSWNSNLKLNLSTAGLLENCQKSHFLAETDQNPPLQSSYKGSLVKSKLFFRTFDHELAISCCSSSNISQFTDWKYCHFYNWNTVLFLIGIVFFFHLEYSPFFWLPLITFLPPIGIIQGVQILCSQGIVLLQKSY